MRRKTPAPARTPVQEAAPLSFPRLCKPNEDIAGDIRLRGILFSIPQKEAISMEENGSILKKVILIIAGGILFGLIAGVVMIGVNVAASGMIENIYTTVMAAGAAAGNQAAENPAPEPEIQPLPEETQGSRAESSSPAAGLVTDVSNIVDRAMPSVVAITSTAVYQTNNYGYGWFFGGGSQTYEVPSSGSGIIIGENDTELLIVTNNHVVKSANSLKVTFINDEVVDAAIKGTDSETDLAIIAVPLESIPAETKSKIAIAVLGNSDELKVGQGVVAIGNALGYGQSVTVGYVSALNRQVKTSEGETRTLLQTDAAINPGNSGGALLNMKGEVIGINAAKYSSTDVEGIGYAIPVSGVEDILGGLMQQRTRKDVEESKRGYLGIQGTTVDQESMKSFGMPQGIFVYKILENGAAAGTELREKDIITRIDGQRVRNMTELQTVLASYEMGEQVELTVETQESGVYKEHTVTITLAAMPK
jgi:serine protease Do